MRGTRRRRVIPGHAGCARGDRDGSPGSAVGVRAEGPPKAGPAVAAGWDRWRRQGEVPGVCGPADGGRVPWGRRAGGRAAPGRVDRPARTLPAAEQGAAQSAQRGEERDAARAGPRALGAVVRAVTRGQLTHERRRLGRFPLRDRRPREDREMAVEARTARAAAAGDRRDPGPAAHCYLFHVTPHPYDSTRPGQGNPIAPYGHPCIEVTGFTFPVRVLTNTRRLLSESDRFQGELNDGLAGGLRRAAVRFDSYRE